MSILVALVLLGSIAGTIFAIRKTRAAPADGQPAVRGRGDLALVHAVNHARCTGCCACVTACPERVLEFADEHLEVAHPDRCTECEACSWACPTGALVMHAEGAEPPPLLLPETDDDCQSAIPGLYLIGEVAGQPHIKNAANLGRGVVEHMLKSGLCPGALAGQRFAEGSDAGEVQTVDVAIVGAGPGGISAALACIQRGLSYVVLEREQRLASTIYRMPRGAPIAAAPRQIRNVSLLPVPDTTREGLLGIWEELAQRVGLAARLGEAVEHLRRLGNGMFDLRTNVAAYRAQRVVLATGGRGRARTLGVPGENLAKVACELDNPNAYRNMPVLVVGGGDSACEAALALADAGARTILSYRGSELARATPRNREMVLEYADRNLLKLKLGSQVERFAHETVTLEMSDGVRKRYPNRAAFVLLGCEPPLRWLDRLGIGFREYPHTFAPPPSDRLVTRYATDAEGLRSGHDDAAAAAAQALGRKPRPVTDDDIDVPSVLFKPYLPGDFPAQPFRLPSEAALVTSEPPAFALPPEDRTEPELCPPALLAEPPTEPAASPLPRVVSIDAPRPRLATEETPVGSPPPGAITDSHELDPFSADPASCEDEGSAPRRAVIVGLAKAIASQPKRRRRTSHDDRKPSPAHPHVLVLDDEPSDSEKRMDFVLVDYDTPAPRAKSLSEIDFDFD